MNRAAVFLVDAAMVLSRPAFYAGLVLAMLLAFRLVHVSWLWVALLLAAPVLSILFALAVARIGDVHDGATTEENKTP